MFRLSSPIRSILFYGTALVGLSLFVFPKPSMAACSHNTPPSNTPVTCNGLDNIGVTGGNDDVSVGVNGGASINTAGSAVVLGLNAAVSLSSNANITSNVNAIDVKGGSSIATSTSASSIISTTGSAIVYTGAAGATFSVSLSGSNISGGNGTAIDFGQSVATMSFVSTPNITGSVIAGAGTTDRLVLGGTGTTGVFNVSNIGTQFLGFDLFTKQSGGTWTLTGIGNQRWSITNGILRGTTDSIQGDVANSGTLEFQQAVNGTYNGLITNGGVVLKSGAGTVTITNANTYTGGTNITVGALNVSANNNLGGVAGGLTLNGGALQYGASFDMARTITLGASNGMIDTQAFNTNLSGVIGGAGSLTKTGAGTLTLSGVNTYLGGTIINGGVVSVAANNNLGGTAGGLTLNGGTLQYTAAFDTARDILLGASNGTLATQGFNTTLSGNISGVGSLTKTGSGVLTLSGTNNYAGGTTVSGGRLVGSTTSLQGNILNNAAIDFNQPTNGTYGGILSGTGTMEKTGAGTLTLTGVNTYNGATTVSNGGLIVNGSIASSATTIASGAYLGGSGTVGGLTVNGEVRPGNSIDMLNVSGGVTFNNGSIYQVEVDDAGNSDRIVATGAIILNGGTVDVRATAGNYNDATNYTILQGLSRTGNFSGVTSDLAFLTPTLSYTANSVGLALTRNDKSFTIVADDNVQTGVATAVENLGSGNPLYNAFVGLNEVQASKALDTLSGEHNSGLSVSTMQSNSIARSIVMTRAQSMAHIGDVGHGNLMALRPVDGVSDGSTQNTSDIFSMMEPSSGGSALNRMSRNEGWWGEFFGSDGETKKAGTAPGQNREGRGALVGIDKRINDNTIFGVFGGWERGEVYTNTQAANTDVRNWHGGLYGSYSPSGPWRISGGLFGSLHKMETTRHIAFSTFNDTAKGKTQGTTFSAYTEAGYTLDYQPIAIEPFVGIGIAHTSIDKYRETEGGASNLDVDGVSQTMPNHTIGVRAGKSITIGDVTVNMRGKVGWDHNYGSLTNKSDMQFVEGNTPFVVYGAERARDSMIAGVGFDFNLAPEARLYTDYEGSYASDVKDHGLTVGVKVKF